MRTAYIFPGQGSQYVGMAREFIESDSETRKALENFRLRTGYDLEAIMLEGPEDKLKETRFTQPAILLHSFSAFKLFQKRWGKRADYVAGHSLGEFSALVANGCLSPDDAMYLVHKRGEFMIRASEGQSYAMAAIIGLAPGEVVAICEKAASAGIVIAANFNTPVQTVISGTEEGVGQAMELAREAGAKRVVPLIVGGAFHSPLVAKAEIWLREEMDKLEFKKAEIPVVANVDAKVYINPEDIKNNLGKQIYSSVKWLDSVNFMIAKGVGIFVEFGPQSVLSGMLRKIDRNVITLNVEKPEDIAGVCAQLEEL
ncbi:MAG: ACP S-malonyltransferase [Candidatus Cloacimonetes bacterium]|nr:ACP S-malonyltransferase [Candidatus Cloacimonadota bacterium]